MKKIIGILCVALVFALLMFPYIWQGKGVPLNVWDNLDSNVVWYKMLQEQDKMFAGPGQMVQGFVTSTPRFSYPSGFNLEAVLFYWFPPFTAYWINKLLISLIAFLGMILLFSIHFKCRKREAIGIGLLWATLAYNPHIGISIAGIPLVFWSFLNLRKEKALFVSLLFVIFYSFYSSFVLVGIFTLFLLLNCLLYWRILDGKFSKLGFLGLILMGICYVVQEINLFYFIFFQNDFVSHRAEMDYRFNSFSNHSPWFFIKSGNHNGVFYWWGYVLLLGGAIFLLFFKKPVRFFLEKMPKSDPGIIVIAFIFTIAIPFLGSFLSWAPVINLAGDIFPLIHSFNLSRLAFILPFFLFLILGYGIINIHFRYKDLVVGVLLAINIFVYQFEWRNMINNRFGFLDYQIPTYSQYYAEMQFNEIKEYLGENWKMIQVGSINMPPAVAVFNGFIGIDGYLPLYALEYKQNFKKIIIGELSKDPELYEHFQYWGNKCYLQNATHPDRFDAYKWQNFKPIVQLDFDFDLLKEGFDTPYLFSAVEIQDTRLQLLKLFTHKGSAWDIYMYKVL